MNETETKCELLTVGQIAERLNEPPARVAYIISKYHIKPVKRIGIFRLFGEAEISRIVSGLFNIQIRRDRP